MNPVISKERMRALDAHMIQTMHIPSIVLMENAAFGITCAIAEQFDFHTPIVAVCGTGNNGGDGFAAARQLAAKGYGVSVYLIGKKDNLSGDAASNAAFFGDDIIEITDETLAQTLLSDLDGCVVIDAIFGIGLSRDVGSLYAAAIKLLNQSGAYIIACDIPSGIDADSGQVLGIAVRANQTVTFQCEKPGLLIIPGREYTGKLTVKEIGVAGDFDLGHTVYADGLTLPARSIDAHKGTFGRLACVVSGAGTVGAGLMCVGGALRAGAGLTTAGIPNGTQTAFNTRWPECMTFTLSAQDDSLSEHCLGGIDKLMEGKTVLAAGCGLTTSDGAAAVVHHLVSHYDIPKVLDADALNIISQNISILRQKQGEIILTPHLMEFSRLSGRSITEIQTNPIGCAQEFAAEYGVTLLLKGATTIITNGRNTAIVTAGTPGMAKGGSGDVLTGVIGGLLAGASASGLSVIGCAIYGAYICGKAGELTAAKHGEHSMTATDTLNHIGKAMQAMTI